MRGGARHGRGYRWHVNVKIHVVFVVSTVVPAVEPILENTNGNYPRRMSISIFYGRDGNLAYQCFNQKYAMKAAYEKPGTSEADESGTSKKLQRVTFSERTVSRNFSPPDHELPFSVFPFVDANNKDVSCLPIVTAALVDESPVDPVIDTGTSVTIMSLRCATKMCIYVHQYPSQPLKGIRGKLVEPAGVTNVSITVADCVVRLPILILEEFDQNLLVGNDFLLRTDSAIDTLHVSCENLANKLNWNSNRGMREIWLFVTKSPFHLVTSSGCTATWHVIFFLVAYRLRIWNFWPSQSKHLSARRPSHVS